MRPDRLPPCPPAAVRRTAFVVFVAFVSSLIVLLGESAQAQSVQKCLIDGRTVFQSSPCPLEARVMPRGAVAPQAVATGPTGAPKKKTLADLLRERDGADRPRHTAREDQADGGNILRSRMGAL